MGLLLDTPNFKDCPTDSQGLCINEYDHIYLVPEQDGKVMAYTVIMELLRIEKGGKLC